MKLKIFKERDRKKISIFIFTISCILLITSVILYRTFAIFEIHNELDIMNGKIEEEGDLYFAFYTNGEIQKEMPQKEEGYDLDEKKSYCGISGKKDPSITLFLDRDTWAVGVKGMTTSRTKCNLYFKKTYDTQKIYDLSKNHYDGMFIDGTQVQEDEEGHLGIYFDGQNDYVDVADLPASINWEDGFTIEFEAKWLSFHHWSRILDFGDEEIKDNIVVTNMKTTNELRLDVRYDGYNHSVSKEAILELNKKDHYKLEVVKNKDNYSLKGIKNGVEFLSSILETTTYVRNVDRNCNYLGKSFSATDEYFHGYIYFLKITDAQNNIILWYDF